MRTLTEQEIWELYELEMGSRKPEDYEIDRDQMKKLIKAYSFMTDFAAKNDGRVDELKYEPTHESCGITGYFALFFLYGDDLQAFNEIMGDIVSISIDALLDGTVCVSFTIPNVFRRKQ